MIKLFRLPRKNLIFKSRIGKYFIYAFGEVILLMFGILFALQVKNWNNKRLERLEEIEILKSVKKDLENTANELEFLNGIRGLIISATAGIFKISNQKNFEDNKLDSLISQTCYRPTFNNELGTINLLFSSGKISLIQNDSIRGFLISWPGAIDDATEEDDYANNLFLNM